MQLVAKKVKSKDLELCVPVVAAILLKHRSKQMGLLQIYIAYLDFAILMGIAQMPAINDY